MAKKRTKEHIIGDLGYNWVERQVLLAGYVIYQTTKDYGYDGIIITFDEHGELEGGHIFIQVKSTEQLKTSRRGGGFVVKIEKRDLEVWVKRNPIALLALCDVVNLNVYYVHIQQYFLEKGLALEEINSTINIYFSPEQVLNAKSLHQIRTIKNNLS